MGIFDVFSSAPAENAARLKQAELERGFKQYTDLTNKGIGEIGTNYTAALQPWQSFQTGATRGMDAYGDATGANGPEGLARARAQFDTMVQPDISRAIDMVGRGGVAKGVATGNIIDEQTRSAADTLAGRYSDYASRLQPFLGASATGAGGIAGVRTGQGNALANMYGQQGQTAYDTSKSIAQTQYDQAMAPYTASANLWNFGLNAAKTAASFIPGGGGGGGGNAAGFQASQANPNTWIPAPRLYS